MTKQELEAKVKRLEKELAGLKGTETLHVAIIQDKSGSMSGQVRDVIGGYNTFIKELRAEKETENILLTLAQFDTNYRVVHEAMPIGDASALTIQDYRPGGGTALLDGVGKTVESLRKAMGQSDRALVVVMTDGYENSSRSYNSEQITSLISELEGTDRWTFVYLGADQDAWATGTAYGFTGGNTFSFASADTSKTYRSLASATTNYTSQGAATMDNFANLMESEKEDDGEKA